MTQRRLGHLPRLPHKPKPKRPVATKRARSLGEAADRELMDLLDAIQDGKRCSSNRGMISTKLQGR